MILNEQQRDAVYSIPDHRISGLVGRAGAGKTSASLELIRELKSYGFVPLLSAPTHKATKVLSAKAGEPAQTLHSLLNLIPMPDLETGERKLAQVGEVSLPDNGFLVIDEASMLSPRLLECIEESGLPYTLIGDEGQLPPVGYTSAVFRDHLSLNRAPVFELTKIMRQAGDNPLPYVAEKLRPGSKDLSWPEKDVMGDNGGVRVVRRPQAEAEFLAHAKAHDGDEDSIRPWLSYTNNAAHAMGQQARVARMGKQAYSMPYLKGEVCVIASPLIEERQIVLPNSAVVTIHSDPVATELNLHGYDCTAYRMTVQTETGALHDIFAMPMFARAELLGALAGVASACHGAARRQAWKRYFEVDDILVDLRSAYSSTIHRSQGSGYPDVFIDSASLMSSNAAPILQGLKYTAITRPYHTAVVAL